MEVSPRAGQAVGDRRCLATSRAGTSAAWPGRKLLDGQKIRNGGVSVPVPFVTANVLFREKPKILLTLQNPHD